jgi:proline racemase
MASRHTFKVIDSHTGGNPTRLGLSCFPTLLGDSVAAKMQYFKAHHDWIRTAMVLEPRGGNLTSSAVLVR